MSHILNFLCDITGWHDFAGGYPLIEPDVQPDDDSDKVEDENFLVGEDFRPCSTCADPNLSLDDERCITCRALLPSPKQARAYKIAKAKVSSK